MQIVPFDFKFYFLFDDNENFGQITDNDLLNNFDLIEAKLIKMFTLNDYSSAKVALVQ